MGKVYTYRLGLLGAFGGGQSRQTPGSARSRGSRRERGTDPRTRHCKEPLKIA